MSLKHLRVSLLLFYDDSGNILLNHRKDHQQAVEEVWEIIGGGIEENENPSDTIKREIYEELGYKIDEIKDDLKFLRKLGVAYLFKAKFPGFQSFSDTNEVKVADLKLFSIKDTLKLKLLPISRKILGTTDINTLN